MAQSLEELLHLAHSALDSDADIGDTIERMEEYARGFNEWFAPEKAVAGDPQVDELVALHGKILDRARVFQQETTDARKLLQRRAKVVIRYLDTLPRRISILRGKKG